jgi:hypothetical protein
MPVDEGGERSAVAAGEIAVQQLAIRLLRLDASGSKPAKILAQNLGTRRHVSHSREGVAILLRS